MTTTGPSELAVRSQVTSIQEVRSNIALVQQIMREVMSDGEHYGLIPGCPRPSLYQPGAEKLALAFRLAPAYEIRVSELRDGHREYRTKCILSQRDSGLVLGEASASCNTLEGRYRYRTLKVPTGEPIPSDYKENKGAYRAQGLVCDKIDEVWCWCRIERGEHDNPADFYNTCEQMAQKRAFVRAVRSVTAASDIFTQDEDLPPEEIAQRPDQPAPKIKRPQRKPPPERRPPPPQDPRQQRTDPEPFITHEQQKRLFAIATEANVSHDDIKEHLQSNYGVESTSDIAQGKPYEDICAWIESQRAQAP